MTTMQGMPHELLLGRLQVVVERAAAVVGNLSGREQCFPAMREAGAMQRLVALLERGPESRVTEIAAKTLANLAVDESNQTAIRLAGGIPPLMRLLTAKPSEQVLQLSCSLPTPCMVEAWTNPRCGPQRVIGRRFPASAQGVPVQGVLQESLRG
jgi:hypothetical protein